VVVEPGRGGDQGQERAPHGIDPAGELVEGVGAVADQPVPGDGGDDRPGHPVDVRPVPQQPGRRRIAEVGGDERLGVLVVLASLVRRDA
jgi:hypothetical protein